jgi:hypothetical protein
VTLLTLFGLSLVGAVGESQGMANFIAGIFRADLFPGLGIIVEFQKARSLYDIFVNFARNGHLVVLGQGLLIFGSVSFNNGAETLGSRPMDALLGLRS